MTRGLLDAIPICEMNDNLSTTKQNPFPIDWLFLLKWVGANLGGWLGGWLISWPIYTGLGLTSLAYERGWDMTLLIRLESLIPTLITGLAIGLAQWLVLRARLPLPGGWWVAVTTIGWLIPQLPGYLLGEADMGAAFALGLATGLVTGAVVGAAQWLVLQAYLPRAGWWILANGIGWLVCWLFTPLTITISAVATGFTLLWLLQESGSKPTPVPSTTDEPAWLQAVKVGQPLPPASRQKSGLLAHRPGLKPSLRIWQTAILQPRLSTFEAFKPKADFGTALIWMLAAGVVNGLAYVLFMAAFYLLFFRTLIPAFLGTSAGFPEMESLFGGFMLMATFLNGFLAIVMAPVSLLIVSGILFVLARLFGGQGGFQEQTYLLATFYAPFHLLSRSLGLIPLLGTLLALGLFFYQIIPARYAIQASHPQLTGKQAWLVILIPVGIIVALIGAFIALWSLLFLGPLLLSNR